MKFKIKKQVLMFSSKYWKLTFTYLGILTTKKVSNENQQIKQTVNNDKQKLEESMHQCESINGKVSSWFGVLNCWQEYCWFGSVGKSACTQASDLNLIPGTHVTEGKTRLQKDIPWSSCRSHIFPIYPIYIKKCFLLVEWIQIWQDCITFTTFSIR